MNAIKQAKKNKKASKVKQMQMQRSLAFAYLKGIDEVKYIIAQCLQQGGDLEDLLDVLYMKEEEDGTYSTTTMVGYKTEHVWAPPNKS